MEKDITKSYSITELNIVPLVLGAHVDLNNLIVNNSVQFLNINVLESYRAVCEMRVGLYIFILPAEVLDEWLLPHKGINFIFVQLFQRRNIPPESSFVDSKQYCMRFARATYIVCINLVVVELKGLSLLEEFVFHVAQLVGAYVKRQVPCAIDKRFVARGGYMAS